LVLKHPQTADLQIQPSLKDLRFPVGKSTEPAPVYWMNSNMTSTTLFRANECRRSTTRFLSTRHRPRRCTNLALAAIPRAQTLYSTPRVEPLHLDSDLDRRILPRNFHAPIRMSRRDWWLNQKAPGRALGEWLLIPARPMRRDSVRQLRFHLALRPLTTSHRLVMAHALDSTPPDYFGVVDPAANGEFLRAEAESSSRICKPGFLPRYRRR
jgi:hypothetical protein